VSECSLHRSPPKKQVSGSSVHRSPPKKQSSGVSAHRSPRCSRSPSRGSRLEHHITKKVSKKRDTNHDADNSKSSDEEAVTIVVMMKMLQDLQKEVVSLRQEVSLLKAERVASTTVER
jgi:hypothetical protein